MNALNIGAVRLGVVVCALFGYASYSATLTVSNLDDSGPGSLRDIIAAAGSGDTIRFAATGSITLTSGALAIDKDLNIQGPGDPAIVFVQRLNNFAVPRYGLFVVGSHTVFISGLTLRNGAAYQANDGGAIRSVGSLTLSNCLFENNLAFDQGGAVWSAGALTVERCTFRNNDSEGIAGAIYHAGDDPLIVQDSIFSGNDAEFGGGAIDFRHTGDPPGAPALRVFRSGFTNNSAGSGGAIAVGSAVTTSAGVLIEDCTFSSNRGQTSEGFGSGGALALGDPGSEPHIVRRCLLVGNSSRLGGAIYSHAHLILDNCTLSGNSSGGVGGIIEASGGQAVVRACTFLSNRPGANYGDIQQGGDGTVQIANTILDRGSGSGRRIAAFNPAMVISLGFNLCSDDGSGFLVASSDQINTAAGLDPLGARPNGGLTATIALMADSPALDRGLSFAVPEDQRGEARPYDLPNYPGTATGDQSDIGAFESRDAVQYSPILVNTLDDHDDGVAGVNDCTLREAIARANAVRTNTVIAFAPGLTGVIMLDRTLGPLIVTGSMSINGPGARVISVSANSDMRVFTFTNNGVRTVSRLTLRDGFHGGPLPGDPGLGGCILNSGTLTLEDCTLDDHYARGEQGPGLGGHGGAARGGGIYNMGSLTLNRCTLRNCVLGGGQGTLDPDPFASGGNGGVAEGAAIYNAEGRTLVINNCTFFRNEASGGHGGDAHFAGNGGHARGTIFNAGTMTITGTTISTNRGLGGLGGIGSNLFNNGAPGAGIGGLVSGGGTNTVRSSICADNFTRDNTPADVNGTFVSGGYNLIGTADGSTGFNGPGDQIGSNASRLAPQLDTLRDNGGHTDTMMPLAGSPALDRGKSFGLTVDQRGETRTSDIPTLPNAAGGDGTDIGAAEQTGYLVVTTLDDHDDGTATATDTTLREAIQAALARPGTDVISFSAGLAGTIQLTAPLPQLSSSMFIEGPGAGQLAVRRQSGGNYRIFTVNNGAIVTIAGLTLTNGNVGSGVFPAESGGGVLNDRSQLTLRACRIAGNSAVAGFTYGGGVFNYEGTLVIDSCLFADNNAYYGGGMASYATSAGSFARANAVGSTFAGNSANGGYGGGVFNSAVGPSAAPMTLVNCTLSGNSSMSGGSGGGIYNSAANSGFGNLNLTHCTLAGNSASSGGGLYNFNFNGSASVVLRNSILNTGESGVNVVNNGGAVSSQGFNISNDAAGGDGGTGPGGVLNASSDVRNTDPQLVPLADNGGLTPTHRLLTSSPALDRGHGFGFATDQRGLARIANAGHRPDAPGGDGADIGALELSPAGSLADLDGDGMPDECESFYGVDDPNADPDNDGSSNLEECRAGTDPRDNASFQLRILSIHRSGNNVIISFTGVSGKTFRLERKGTLSDAAWESIPGLADLTPTSNGAAQIIHPGGLSSQQSFYRVSLLP